MSVAALLVKIQQLPRAERLRLVREIITSLNDEEAAADAAFKRWDTGIEADLEAGRLDHVLETVRAQRSIAESG
jgi:hypothetical protein